MTNPITTVPAAGYRLGRYPGAPARDWPARRKSGEILAAFSEQTLLQSVRNLASTTCFHSMRPFTLIDDTKPIP